MPVKRGDAEGAEKAQRKAPEVAVVHGRASPGAEDEAGRRERRGKAERSRRRQRTTFQRAQEWLVASLEGRSNSHQTCATLLNFIHFQPVRNDDPVIEYAKDAKGRKGRKDSKCRGYPSAVSRLISFASFASFASKNTVRDLARVTVRCANKRTGQGRPGLSPTPSTNTNTGFTPAPCGWSRCRSRAPAGSVRGGPIRCSRRGGRRRTCVWRGHGPGLPSRCRRRRRR